MLAGLQFALLTFALGALLLPLGITELIMSDQQLWEVAFILFVISLTLLFAEKAARTYTGSHSGRALSTLRTTNTPREKQ